VLFLLIQKYMMYAAMGSGVEGYPLERMSFMQRSEEGDHNDDGFVALFDGVSLDGWHATPRIYGFEYPRGSERA
jgi:hypothetical protein